MASISLRNNINLFRMLILLVNLWPQLPVWRHVQNWEFVYFLFLLLTLKGEKLRIGIKTGWKRPINSVLLHKSWTNTFTYESARIFRRIKILRLRILKRSVLVWYDQITSNKVTIDNETTKVTVNSNKLEIKYAYHASVFINHLFIGYHLSD